MSAVSNIDKTFNVCVFGQGPDLALIHGWGLGSAVWTPLLERLAQHFRVHLVDWPGYESGGEFTNTFPESRASACSTAYVPGKPLFKPLFIPTPCRSSTGEASRGSSSTWLHFEDSARGLLTALPAGVTLCGWSLGALLALQAALLAPNRIARLLLVGATPRFTQRSDWAHGQPPALLDTFQAALAEHPQSTLQRFIALLNQGDRQARAIGRALLSRLPENKLPDGAALRDGLDFLREIDLRQHIPSLQTPTLLIHGERDPLMPLAAARWLAEYLPQSRLEIFTEAAHAPFLNDTQRFLTLLADFCLPNPCHAPTSR
jgi:pimeloyl-ACP methyl ester esterase